MKNILRASALIYLVSLAACSTVEPAATPGATASTDTRPVEKANLTGSRIPAKSTEKMVFQIGGKDYTDSKVAQPAPLNAN